MTGTIRVNWSRDRRDGKANLGDLLGPLVIAAFTGQRITHSFHVSPRRRLVSVGTVGGGRWFGKLDVWGSGFAGKPRSLFSVPEGFKPNPLTRLVPHAVRGPFSRNQLSKCGYDVPEVYGDPALIMPRIWPLENVEKRWDMGVFLHMSESRGAFERYTVPAELADSVMVADMWVEPNADAIRDRIETLLSCRRILTTGLHAAILAETYGIPCAAFDIHDGPVGHLRADNNNVAIDHRFRDFYTGCGRESVLVYRTERHLQSDWPAAMQFIDREWHPLRYDPERLLDAFPRHFGELNSAPVVRDAGELDRLVTL